MTALSIGQVAKRCGLTVETIRFYEKLGLILEPQRTESGYRQYPEDAVARLQFIQRSKELGFSLKEIEELLLLKESPDTSSHDIKSHAEAKIQDINQKIYDLEQMKTSLARLTRSCQGKGPAQECEILAALETGEVK